MVKLKSCSGNLKIFLISIGLAYSCAVASEPSWVKSSISGFSPDTRVFSNPEIGLDVSAELGNTLISRSKTLSTPIISVASRVSHSVSGKDINEGKGRDVEIDIPSGTYVAWGRHGERILYKSQSGGLFRYNGFFGDTTNRSITMGLVLKPGEKNSTEMFLSFADPSMATFTNLASPVLVAHDLIVIPDKLNFKQELVYTGVSKNVITIVYREYINDFARAAFSTELKYDLGEGDTIGYKGARFQILKASNVGIDYKVLKHLD